MAKKKGSVLWKSAVQYLGASYAKESAGLGVKIPLNKCLESTREMFRGATLEVTISQDSETGGQAKLEGMDDAHESQRVTVKVNRCSESRSDVSIRLIMGIDDLEPQFLKTISHSQGSLWIHECTYDGADPAEED